MWSKPVCTNRKSASAERCWRALGATLAMGIPVMRRSKHSRQGVFSHQGLRKASAADPANTGLAGSAGMAVPEATEFPHPHRLVGIERDATDEVFHRLLRRQRHRDAADAQPCQHGDHIDAETVE